MQTMFLKIEAITKKLKGKEFTVVRTDLNAPVPENSIELWQRRGFKPCKTGIAEVKFAGNELIYLYPLFFETKDPDPAKP